MSEFIRDQAPWALETLHDSTGCAPYAGSEDGDVAGNFS